MQNQPKAPFQLNQTKSYRFQPSLPGIEYAPEQVRRHGLQEAHTFPLVSAGKVRGTVSWSKRVHAWEAWREWASVELRSATAWPALVLDCDGASGYARIMLAFQDREVPLPNWIVYRVSGGAHLVYTLEAASLAGGSGQGKSSEEICPRERVPGAGGRGRCRL